MDEQLKKALDLLVQHGYLETVKGKLRVSAKLNDAVSFANSNLPFADSTNWESAYIKYIADAQVPRRSQTTDGNVYDLNKYSVDGMKRFRQMIEKERIDYDLLVKVTKAYYKSPGTYKKKIGNYITEDLWRTDYMVLKQCTTSSEQSEHLKNLQDDPQTFARDRIG